MSAGIVYVLTNEAMPGFVKIGLTQKNDVGDRVRQLDNIPLAFSNSAMQSDGPVE